jgi:urease accessory protein
MSTTTATHTATTTSTSRLELRVELREGRSVVTRCAGQVPLAARILARASGRARVALVQTAASIVAGDRLELAVELGEGAVLELSTLGATIAYPGEAASQSLTFDLDRDARLAWLPAPLVLTEGCDLRSRCELELAPGAAAVIREVVALGRHGEAAGRCRNVLRCDLGGIPLLRDSIEVDADSSDSQVQLGGAQGYGTVALLGVPPTGTDGELALEGPGAVFRTLGADGASVTSAIALVERRYLEALYASERVSTRAGVVPS